MYSSETDSGTAFTYKLQLSHLSTNAAEYILTPDGRKTLTFRGNSKLVENQEVLPFSRQTGRNTYKFTVFVPPADQTLQAARACAHIIATCRHFNYD